MRPSEQRTVNSTQAALEAWYAARGSRVVSVFDQPVNAPAMKCFCGQPARRSVLGPRCADHFPKVVR